MLALPLPRGEREIKEGVFVERDNIDRRLPHLARLGSQFPSLPPHPSPLLKKDWDHPPSPRSSPLKGEEDQGKCFPQEREIEETVFRWERENGEPVSSIVNPVHRRGPWLLRNSSDRSKKIPLYPPLQKGEDWEEPPFLKGEG